MKTRLWWGALICVAFTLLVYARSLRYQFVYDDHWRVENNTAIRSLKNIPQFFTDRTSSSSRSELHQDNYRPLVTTSFAIDYFMWNLHPAGYRLTNIMLHALCGFFVMMLGMELLLLTPLAAFLSAMVFLFHPLQLESVVWISERTNPLALLTMLAALFLWLRNKKTPNIFLILGLYAFYLLGIGSRETGLCLPLILLAVEMLQNPTGKIEGLIHIALLVFMNILYLVVRFAVLGRIAMAPFWGGSFLSNLANVMGVIPLYVKKLFWPFPLQLTFANLPIIEHWYMRRVVWGSLIFILGIGLIFKCWKVNKRWALCLTLAVLFWLPGSNLIPLTTLFAERLLYPIMISMGWIVGLLFDRVRNYLHKFICYATVGMIAFLLMIGTGWAMPVWKNDVTLWEQQTHTAPDSWFAWACYGEAQYRFYLQQNYLPGVVAVSPLDQIELNLIQALSLKPPLDTAAILFYLLSDVNIKQNKKTRAAEHLRRAQILQEQLRK